MKHQNSTWLGTMVGVLMLCGCTAAPRVPPLTVSRPIDATAFDGEPLVTAATVSFTYDPFFANSVSLELAERTNFDGKGMQLRENFFVATSMPPPVTSGTQGQITAMVPRGSQASVRIVSENLNGKQQRSDIRHRQADMLPTVDLPVRISQMADGIPQIRWVDSSFTQPQDLRWAMRSQMHPYPDRWEPAESLQGLETWLLGAPDTEILVWRAQYPTHVTRLVVDPALPAFTDTITGTLDTKKGVVRLTGWNRWKWSAYTLCVFDLGSRQESTVASASGADKSIEFAPLPAAGSGRYAIAACRNDSHGWTRLSNIVDLCAPTMPGQVHLQLGGGKREDQYIMYLQWHDHSDNEEFFEVERGEWKDQKTVRWQPALEFQSGVAAAADRPVRVVDDSQWQEEYPWVAFDGYAIQYRVRAGRQIQEMLAASGWAYSEPLLKPAKLIRTTAGAPASSNR